MQALMHELIALYTGLLQLQGYPLPPPRARTGTGLDAARQRSARAPA